MNYDEMPAGPELDRLIAEKVMGWEYSAAYNAYFLSDGKREREPSDWSPSTNIAQAWEVVEHMTQTTKETWEFRSTTTLHTAIFEFDGGRDRPWKPGQYVGDALTMPLAICRAALRASLPTNHAPAGSPDQ